jgi:hypothetical protein
LANVEHQKETKGSYGGLRLITVNYGTKNFPAWGGAGNFKIQNATSIRPRGATARQGETPGSKIQVNPTKSNLSNKTRRAGGLRDNQGLKSEKRKSAVAEAMAGQERKSGNPQNPGESLVDWWGNGAETRDRRRLYSEFRVKAGRTQSNLVKVVLPVRLGER